MSVSSRIQANYSKLTKTEQKIADYITEHNSGVAFQTLGEVAGAADVATTSVIRLARELGYDGFAQMQSSIQRSLVKKVSLPERYDESYAFLKKGNLLHDLVNAEISSLQRTVDILDETALHQAVEAINGARNVYVLGARATFGLAHFMASYLYQVRDGIHLVSGIGGIYPEEISEADNGDVCIAYMFPRYQKMMSSLLACLRSRGVKVILITVEQRDDIKHLGDIFLCCSLQSGIMTKDSMISPLFVSNYLLNCIMAGDYARTRSKLEKMEDILNKGFYFGV